MTDPAGAIVVQHLRKAYGGRPVIADVSFTVPAGTVFALLGPNGAGKTTTVEILEGYRSRDGGSVAVLGRDPARAAPELRCRIGLMLQEGGVYPQAKPREILRLFATFYPNPEDPDRLLKLVGLESALKTSYRRLSGGQKQRLSLALALIGRPELIFLDEPTAGLDPQARRSTWDIIASLRERGVTVVLTTHYLEEAERLADQIVILDQGRVIAAGTPATLRGQATGPIRLAARGDLDAAALAALPTITGLHPAGPGVWLLETRNPPACLAEVTAWAARAGVAIQELRVGSESLEDVYLRLTNGGSVA